MFNIPPSLVEELSFYLTSPSPCPYLPQQAERKLFTRLKNNDPKINADINGSLCRIGFRRSQNIVYRPMCLNCEACMPVRIPVGLFKLSRSQRRVAAKNKDLTLSRLDAQTSPELFDLFARYEKSRHKDSDMALMTEGEFSNMICDASAGTQLFCLRDVHGLLKGCMIADPVGDGFSAVYSFFDPGEPRRSLGTALVLSLIDAAEKEGLPFVYLGYWIKESPKMAYKGRFKPLQCFSAGTWRSPELFAEAFKSAYS